MQALPKFEDPNLLIGADHFSDAGVYRLADGLAIVESLDFFPPIVDDPFVYGQIAAANALSDLYATGATPRTAMNIVCFPDGDLGLDVLERILAGGAERVRAAGAVIVGGHSVRDAEVKYGLSVSGVVDPAKMMSNRGARAGDALVLTKPLGTGFVTTALRAGRCPDDVLAAACASMIALNRAASEAAVALGARGATDITGFGLAGHGMEMAIASDVTVRFRLDWLPILPGAAPLAAAGNRTRANEPNRAHVEPHLAIEAGAARDERLAFLFDPQTSGGLLVAVGARRAGELVQRCRDGGATAAIVGEVLPAAAARIVVS